MLNKETIVRLTNRDNGRVGYSVPDLGITRTFQSGETKEVTVEEVRKLSYVPGGLYILENCLVINNAELVNELFSSVEPEYYYSEEDVKNLLQTGSLDSLLDCLDFAPSGVVDLVKDLAVKLEINDVAKRKAIFEKTGFNVDRAIEINKETSEEHPEEKKVRRSAIPTEETETKAARRTAPPKYNVVKK